MSASEDTENRSEATLDGKGVLSNLPRTRPQRSTARRAAARKADATPAAAKAVRRRPAAKAPAKGSAKAPAAIAKTRTAARVAKPKAAASTGSTARAAEPVPRQGFESEADRARGPVQPPGGAEFVATAAEIVSELTKAGLSTGERVLKDIVSRLSPS
jgi:hypothetical protein